MGTVLKHRIAELLVRSMLPRLLSDDNEFHRTLGEAVRLQLSRITDDEFRRKLDRYYASIDLQSTKHDLDYEAKRAQLLSLNGYKSNVIRLEGDAPSGSWRGRFTPWGRRFALLSHLNINADVLALRHGESIPPHGHNRVVSGFYVLDGEVAVRHYDRIEEIGNMVRVRKTVDTKLGPGTYTTNSEFHDSIHWLEGIAPASLLFRLNVKDTPTGTFGGSNRKSDRVYVDPTGQPAADGSIMASYVTEDAARTLKFS